MSRSTPTAFIGSTMSEKKIAASTPYRRTGCRVISTTRSGRMHESSIATPSRSVRYSGSDRPACRMNQTGCVRHRLAPGGAQERGVLESGVLEGGGWSSRRRSSQASAACRGSGTTDAA